MPVMSVETVGDYLPQACRSETQRSSTFASQSYVLEFRAAINGRDSQSPRETGLATDSIHRNRIGGASHAMVSLILNHDDRRWDDLQACGNGGLTQPA